MRSRFSAILSNNAVSAKERAEGGNCVRERGNYKSCAGTGHKNKKNLRKINSKQRANQRQRPSTRSTFIRYFMPRFSFSFDFRFGFRFSSIGRAGQSRLPNLLLLIHLLHLLIIIVVVVVVVVLLLPHLLRSLRFCFFIHEIPGNL